MGFKKWSKVSLTLMLALSLAACGSNNGGSNTGTSNSGSNTPSNSGGGVKEEKLEPVTFSLFNAGSSRPDIQTKDTDIGKIHFDNTGVNFAIEHLVGDVKTKIGTMIASGDYPDVVVPDSEIDKMVDAEAFIPLNDLIEEHGPNIKRVYGPFMNLLKDTDDGNIYFLPFGPQVGEFVPDPVIGQGAFWMQRRVLEEFDYPKITTLDEYFGLIEQYTAKYPNEDLTGFTALTHDWRFFVLTNPPNHLAGYPNDGGVQIDMETLEATDFGDEEETKRWLKALSDLNAKGLFDKTSFVNNYDQYIAKLVSGKVLGHFDYGWQTNNANQTLKQATVEDPGNAKYEYFPLPIVFDKDIKDQYIDPPAFVNNRGIGITVSAKDPVRIIKFFDYLLTDESQTLNQWGIEGVTYEVTDEGRMIRTPEQIQQIRDNDYRAKVGLMYYEYYWPMYGQGSSFPDGNAVSPGRQPEVAEASFTEQDKFILSKYGVKTYSEMFASPDDRPWYPAWSIALEQGSEAEIFSTRKQDLQKKYFPRLVLASPAEFDSVWDEYYEDFNKLNVKVYEDTMTELVKAKVKAIKGE
jgi:putative aldouronate transport system substrate-binding protein